MKLPIPPQPVYDLTRHLEHVQKLFETYPLNTYEKCSELLPDVLDEICDGRFPHQIAKELGESVRVLLRQNQIFFNDVPDEQNREYLVRLSTVLSSPSWATNGVKATVTLFKSVLAQFPPSVFDETPANIKVPLYTLIADVPGLIAEISNTATTTHNGAIQTFENLHKLLAWNAIEASGYDLETYDGQPLIFAHDSDLETAELVKTYLRKTPFEALLCTLVPFSIPQKTWAQHGIILAPCLHPKTPIYDPVDGTTYTVRERSIIATTFHVFAKNGSEVVIAQALPPVRFKRRPMFRMTNGEHEIFVTADHRVWNGEKYESVRHLRPYAFVRLPTISERALSALKRDAFRLLRTAQGSHRGYHPSRHSNDAPLHAALNSDLSASPLQADALVHNRKHSRADAPAYAEARSRAYQYNARLSKEDYASQSYRNFQSELECLIAEASAVSSFGPHAIPEKFHQSKARTHKASSLQTSFQRSILSYIQDTMWTLHPTTEVVDYYDFHVPHYNNYYACGLFHHNTGHGKTQLLQSLIAGFLNDTDPPGTFILDPHGDMFSVLMSRIEPSRLIVLDPDVSPPPLNFLDFGHSTEAQTLQTFSYLMSSLSGGLSDKQGAIVPYLLKLLRQIPDASMETLRQIVDEKVKSSTNSAFISFISQLPAVDQGFFANQFYSARMQETKDAIGWKLYSALSSDAFRQMFSAKTNSINFDQCIAERKVVLVKGGRAALGDDGMRVFLQFILAQYFSAGLRRDRLPPEKRHLCIMFADECQMLMGSPILANLFVEMRKYGCSWVGATQTWFQIADEVRSAVLGATAIRFVGSVSHNDAVVLSREMHTTPDFIRSMRSTEGKGAEWATYVSNVTPKAIRLSVPFGQLERMPLQPRLPESKSKAQSLDVSVIERIKTTTISHPPIVPQPKEPIPTSQFDDNIGSTKKW